MMNNECQKCGGKGHCVVNAKVRGGRVRGWLCARHLREFRKGDLMAEELTPVKAKEET